jgi:hypothetical protein
LNVRWHAKKMAARREFVLGGRAVHGPSRLAGGDPHDAVRVRTFHVIGGEPRNPFAAVLDRTGWRLQVSA